MNYDPAKHHCRYTRLKGYDYSASGGYFLTKRSLTMRQNIELDTLVVMPNHFHGIVEIINTVGANALRPYHYQQLRPHTLHTYTLHP